MGYFTKKADPLSARARVLNSEIAALEAQIQRLNVLQEKAARKRKPAPRKNGAPKPAASPSARRAAPRSEPVFEELKGRRLGATPSPAPRSPSHDLGLQKPPVFGRIRRFIKQFQSPPPSNPKLVNYLAAGSIQGLRPLRFEKRIARNRFLFLVVFLVLLLLGILTSFIRQ